MESVGIKSFKEKPAFWLILLALLACVVVAVCFLMNLVPNGKYTVKLRIERPVEWISAFEEGYGFYAKDELGDRYGVIWEDVSELSENSIVIVEFDRLEHFVDTDLMGSVVIDYEVEAKQVTVSLDDFEYQDNIKLFISASENASQSVGAKEIDYYKDIEKFQTVFEDKYGYNWISNDSFKVMCDFTFEIEGIGQVGYYSEEGLVNDYANNRCLELPKKEKVIFDSIIEKYLYPDSAQRKLTKWFDFSDNPDGIDLEDTFSIKLEEIPCAKFIWDSGEVFVTDEMETTKITYGRVGTNQRGACLNAYFYDLTYDGIPELCATFRYSYDDDLHEIIVYDYITGNIFNPSYSGDSYEFSIINAQLVVVQKQDGEIILQGTPALNRNSKYNEYEFVILDTK